jgi:hypothetical protein
MKKRRSDSTDKDDYRDLVSAGFAVLCAALMLVAGLLFILSTTEESKPSTESEPPKHERPASTAELLLWIASYDR